MFNLILIQYEFDLIVMNYMGIDDLNLDMDTIGLELIAHPLEL